MINGSRYDPTTRQLVERVFELVTEIHADQRALMVEVYGEGTSYGLKTRVVKLEISQSVGKRWVAAVTTLISAVMISGSAGIVLLWYALSN